MSGEKIVKVVELNGNAKGLLNTINELKDGLSGVKMPTEFQKTLEKLSTSLETILKKTEKGVVSREGFIESEKELKKVKAAFEGLAITIDGFGQYDKKKLLSLLPDDTKEKIKQAKAAYVQYATTVNNVVKAEDELTAAKKRQAEAQDKLSQANSSQSGYKGALTRAENELKKYDEITKALDEQEKAFKALKKAEKDYNEAVASGQSEKVIAEREKKKDQAKARKDKADETVDSFDKKNIEAQKTAIEKVAQAKTKLAAATKAAKDAEKAKASADVAATQAKNNLVNISNKNEQQLQAEQEVLNKLKNALAALSPKYAELKLQGQTYGAQVKELKTIIDGLSEEELTKLGQSLENARHSSKQFENGLEETKQQLDATKEEMVEFDKQAEQVTQIQNRVREFLGLAGAAKVLSASLREAFAATKELDAAMTEIAVVTDFNISDMWDQLPEYTERANDLGVSITQAYKSSALFYQQGLKTNEVVAISNETLKMAKIAGLDAKDATDKMTAALRGFNMELNETSAQKVADVYSELAAITASDVKEISSAMTKTASIASSAGMGFETTAAFLSQIIETTRESAETAGTAMKTVIARFQELKKAPEDIGEVDGEIVDANAIEGALRSVGVSLRDSSGQFRELDEVFMELSSKWGTLDKNTQRYIATIAAGSRQQSRFIAMMQDYNRTQELVTAANNSSGASNRQFEKTMDSLEAKLQKLNNAWTEFSTSLLDNGAIKTGVDILTTFVTGINQATSAFDGFMGSVSKIGMLISLFNIAKALFNKFGNKMAELFTSAGQKIGNSIAEGIRSSQSNAVSAARTTGQAVVSAAQEGVSGKKNDQNQSTDGPAPVERVKGTKNRFNAGRIIGGIKSGGKKVIEGVAATPRHIAEGYIEGRDARQAQKAGQVANNFAQNSSQQFVDVASGMQGAAEGDDLRSSAFGLLSGNLDVNALALPLDSIETQFKEKMKTMGAETKEVEVAWQELYDTISGGGTTARDALGAINDTLDNAATEAKKKGIEVADDSNKITVDKNMMQEASTVSAVNLGFQKASVQEVAGQQMLIDANEGTSMASTLGGELGQNMSALALPLQEIESQFKESMTTMGASVDQVEQDWKELYDTITSGSVNAQQAIEKIDAKLADQGEQDAMNWDDPDTPYMGPTSLMNTKKTKKATNTKKGKKDLNKEELKAIKKVEERKEEAGKKQEEINKKAEEGLKKEIDSYKQAAQSISNMGAALSMASVGLATLGAKFAEAGLEEEAEAFNTLSTVVGGVGTVMSFLGTIMSLVIPIMELNKKKSQEQTAANTTESASWWAKAAAALGFQAACWPVLLITLAIVAVIFILVGLILLLTAAFKAAAEASPEGQLKAAEKAAAQAAETADQAAEAYENLAAAFDELDGKYRALEELTKGTKEWNEAVRDINNSVIDLIEQYPELAQFVKNIDGALTIDLDSEKVQGVLKKAESNMVITKNASLAADNVVREKAEEVEYSKLGYTTSRQNTDKLAKALADGVVLATEDGLVSMIEDSELSEKYALTANNLEVFEKQIANSGDDLVTAGKKIRSFGQTLKENEAISKGAFEAMATAAESLANTTGWSQEEILQGSAMVTGDVYEKYLSKYTSQIGKLKKLEGEGSDSKDVDSVEDAAKTLFADDAASQAQFIDSFYSLYGQDASISGGQLKYKVNGEWKEETLDPDKHGKEVARHMASALATKKTTQAMEGSRYTIQDLNSAFGGDNKDIASKLYSDLEDGGELTQGDIDTLKSAGYLTDANELNKTKLEELWNSWGAGSDAQAAFSDDMSIFINQMSGMVDAAKVLADVSGNLKNFGLSDENIANLTKDATAGFAEGIEKQFTEMQNNLKNQGKTDDDISGKINESATLLSAVLAETPEHWRTEIESQFSSLNLKDADAILGFQLDLIHTYGISKEKAEALTKQLVETNLATSKWYTKLTTFNELTGAQYDLEQSLETLTDIQWKYNEALENGAVAMNGMKYSIEEMVGQQIKAIQNVATDYADVYKATAGNFSKIYADGAFRDESGLDYRQFVTPSDDGDVKIDYKKVAEYEKASGQKINMDTFQEWVEELQGLGDEMKEAKESAKEQVEAINELEETLKESYQELRDLAKEAIVNALEEQINLQEQLLDAEQTASQNIISALQNSISQIRQDRENDKTEQALSDSLSKQSYLAADTSGMNLLQLAQERQAFDQQLQDYQDRKIDQSIQKLQDANDKAFDQRERQIAVAEQQLEAYQLSAEFQQEVQGLMDEAMTLDDARNSQLYKMLEFQKNGMSAAEKSEWDKHFQTLTEQANAYKTTNWNDEYSKVYTVLSNIGTGIDVLKQSQEAKTSQQYSELKSQGFEAVDQKTFESYKDKGGSEGAAYTAAGGNYEKYLNTFSNWQGMKHSDSVKSEADSQYSTLSQNGVTVQSRSQYYTANSQAIAEGKDVASYEKYIAEEYDKYYDDDGFTESDGGFPVHMTWGDSQDFKAVSGPDTDMNMWVTDQHKEEGPMSYQVSLGSAVDDQMKNKLDRLRSLGYGGASRDGHTTGVYYNGKAYLYSPDKDVYKPLVYEEDYKTQAGTNFMNAPGQDDAKTGIKDWAKRRSNNTHASGSRGKRIAFAEGGLANFTGPAWLDGTKSRPEYILNPDQTKRFFSLVDVLEGFEKNVDGKAGGDNYFDIAINVEKIEDDYDVEKIADKIRSMIYEDATYRNVNAINNIR